MEGGGARGGRRSLSRSAMFHPTTWGPAAWHVFLCCAWNVTERTRESTVRLLVDLLPHLLPCRSCRESFPKKHRAALRHLEKEGKTLLPGRRQSSSSFFSSSSLPPPSSPRSARAARESLFRWAWLVKNEVNASLGLPSSVSHDQLVARWNLHGAVVDEVVVADALVLFAIDANERRKDVGDGTVEGAFFEACRLLGTLLPLPSDSQFRDALLLLHPPSSSRSSSSSSPRSPRRAAPPSSLVVAAARVARAARTERGAPVLPVSHYLSLSSSSRRGGKGGGAVAGRNKRGRGSPS